jgi:hypothetical protein
MITEQLDESLIGTGHILKSVRRPTKDEPYWIGFHGTSSRNAHQIEREGISGTQKPLQTPDLDFRVALANEIEAWFPELQNNRAFEGPRRQLVNGKGSTVVNFFPLSELALGHTRSKGGQILQRAVKPLITAILGHPAFAQDGRRARLREILDSLHAHEGGFPIVYAVDLHKVRPLGYRGPEMAIQTDVVVKPCHFIAKVEARDFDQHEQIAAREEQLREEANDLAFDPRSKHFVGIMFRGELQPVPQAGPH